MPGLNQFDPGGDPFASLNTTPTTTPSLDLDLVAGPPLVNIGAGSAILEVGSREWLHVLVSATDTAREWPIDLTQYPVGIAIVPQGDPASSDFVTAAWLTRTAADGTAGTYARIVVGPGGELTPGYGQWRVFVQIQAGGEILILKAPGCLKVE